MSKKALPSLGVLLAALNRHLDQQRTHLESLDTKAGVVVGFASAIAALSQDAGSLLAKVGVGLAVVAAILAMLSFRPRKSPVFDPLGLRSYLAAEETFTELRLFDTEIEMSMRASNLIQQKARWLGASLVMLVLAVALLTVATLMT